MADTGAKYPAGAGQVYPTPEDDDEWVWVPHVRADDSQYAYITASTYDTNDISYRITTYLFDFSSIPDDATINGILVEIERRCAAGSARDYRVQLKEDGVTLRGDNKADTANNWPGSDTIKSYGGAADLWNYAWTPALVKGVDFGVVLSAMAYSDNTDIYVDFIRITVYYTVALVRTGSTAIGLSSSATRTLELARTGSAALGLLATAEKVRDFIGSCAIGLAASASRTIDLSRLGSTAVGLLGSGSRAIEVVRSGQAVVGLLGVGSRVVERIRSGATAIGLVATGQKSLNLSRLGSTALGILGSGSRAIELVRSGSVAVGISAVGSRALLMVKTGVTQVALVATGQRRLELSRTGTAVVGLAATSRLLTVRAARRVLKALRTLGVLREQSPER